MPWSNQSGGGGGWKGGGNGGPWGQGPWGQGPGGGNQSDLEEILKRGQNRMKQVMRGGGLPGPLLFLVGALIVAWVVWNGFFFKVNTDEQGIVLRFGEFVRQEPPGLHLRWPYPIEEVRLPQVTKQNTIEIGGGPQSGADDKMGGSLMLTGDENIVDIHFTVQWTINDASQYLFNIQDPDKTVSDVAESAMRDVIGQSELQPILTAGREKIAQTVKDLIQKTLDRYGAGIHIDAVLLNQVSPPPKVIDAFRDVQAARIDNATYQNQATAYANKVVPEAQGEAERIVQAAEGYRKSVIADAQGQTSRFLQVYEQYKRAPEVTRKRMYLETMERIMGGTSKIILDNKHGQGVVPYLPLREVEPRQETKPAEAGK